VAGSPLTIRAASAADLKALIDAFGLERLFAERFFAERLTRQRQRRGSLLVAWEGDELVARVYLKFEPPDERPLRWMLAREYGRRLVPIVQQLEVREGRRGRGIGRRVMEEVEAYLLECGHDRVALAVAPDNDHAIRLYKGLHYEHLGDMGAVNQVILRSGRRRRIGIERCHVFAKDLTRPADPAPFPAPGPSSGGPSR
jgi:GNAT superfamily N-acetyltransferase